MSIGVYFNTKMTLDQYREVHKRLDEAGDGNNPHRLHHSCFGPDGELMIFDVWDSPEAFQAFGATLMPILAEVGVDAGEPAVMPVHKLLQLAADEEA
ncbi:MAG TPA: hypothetical protein VG650_01480 [Mycobacteriales bacterium]|nr:hypothetical protein [Mycobacteriales bacterium]